MKRVVSVGVLIGLLGLLAACGPEISTNVQSSGPTVQEVITYEGPKARIAVASFKCKAAKCSSEIGEGLADMLATSLFKTGRFIVLERGEGLRAIQEELNLAQSGYVQAEKAPQMGLMEGADILVLGAITAFEPEASGIGGGGLVIPFSVPMIGGAAASKKDAYIAADIRLVDVRTGRVINATRVEGKATSWRVGGLGGAIAGTVAFGGALGAFKNTPMEKAIMVMLDNAVQAIAKMVPESYYRYGSTAPPAPAPAATAPAAPAPAAPAPAAAATPSPATTGTGYVAFASPKVLTIKGRRVNIRSGPGTSYSVLTTLSQGQQVKGLGKQGDWYQIQLPDGRVGWVYATLVSE
ncbi:MAG: hypothetical protein DRG33_01215 [Deltaproteobacteria bacterium]|nr:MAG: hypothetical protein DRG33_01215 [Deltaproteobacteria bacterium]